MFNFISAPFCLDNGTQNPPVCSCAKPATADQNYNISQNVAELKINVLLCTV